VVEPRRHSNGSRASNEYYLDTYNLSGNPTADDKDVAEITNSKVHSPFPDFSVLKLPLRLVGSFKFPTNWLDTSAGVNTNGTSGKLTCVESGKKRIVDLDESFKKRCERV